MFFDSCIFIKTSTSPINDIRVFVGVTNSTSPFQDVVKRPFKGFVFYHKIEKKRKKHNRISTPLNHLAHILKVIKKGEEDGLPISVHEGLNEQLK